MWPDTIVIRQVSILHEPIFRGSYPSVCFDFVQLPSNTALILYWILGSIVSVRTTLSP